MKKNIVRLGGGLAIAIFGLCIGAVVSPTPVKAGAIYCEHNLCDNGWLWSSCYASNVSTNCTMYGTWPLEFCYHTDCERAGG